MFKLIFRRTWHTSLMIATGLFCATCAQYDFEEEAGDKTSSVSPRVVPTSLGLGTQHSPYTVEQVRRGDATGVRWVIGYVVGSTSRVMKNATFAVPTENNSNILLATSPDETSPERCIPIELKSTAMQKGFSLHHNPGLLHQCIVVHGTLERYFLCPGVRDIKDAYPVDIDLSSLLSSEGEWVYEEFGY